MSLLAGLVGAAACGVAGAATPYLIRRLPEPPPPEQPIEGEPPKPPYVDLGARRAALPIGVVVSAVVGGTIGLVLGWDASLALWWPLVPAGVLLGYVDAHTRLLPRRVVLPATAYALGFGIVDWLVAGEYDDLVRAVIAMLAVRTLFWVLWFVRRAGMGFGDVRLSALLGFALGHAGWSEVVIGLYAAFLTFAVPFVVLALARRDRGVMRRAYPFGPFLLLGAWLGVLFGEPLARALGY